MLTPADVKSLYPELADVDDSVIQAQLDTFALLYKGEYGDAYDHLQGLYVAHQVTVFTLNTGTGSPESVKSRTVDGLSWSYSDGDSQAKQEAGAFGSTKYGLEFYRLISLFGKGPTMSGAMMP